MFLKVIVSTFLFITLTVSAHAEGKSALGLDYMKITKNPILTEVMLEIEPALIKYYEKHKWAKIIDGYVVMEIDGVALTLSRDSVRQSLMDKFEKLAPEAPLKFLQLDKEKHPNLWTFGNIVRLDIEIAKNKKLYKALNGRDYNENNHKK